MILHLYHIKACKWMICRIPQRAMQKKKKKAVLLFHWVPKTIIIIFVKTTKNHFKAYSQGRHYRVQRAHSSVPSLLGAIKCEMLPNLSRIIPPIIIHYSLPLGKRGTLMAICSNVTSYNSCSLCCSYRWLL